jgi:2-polyprenyl-3-methyl-5-hydroxy-6-metoxy-1,4-benzoquinol methylase
MITCKICSCSSDLLFTKKVLNKYDVKYYQCSNCKFIQTEQAHWLNEAYENIITSLDIGLVGRNIYVSTVTAALLHNFFNTRGKYLDYGGGYGMLVRLMRDKGYDFYRQDKFCENLFSKNFDIEDISHNGDFELVTAFELFEHLINPLGEIESMLGYSNSIFFSTELQPERNNINTWEYLALETGQHIALYHKNTLKEIARKFNLNLYSNGRNLHLLTVKKINSFTYALLTKRKIAFLYNTLFSHQDSYLLKDYNSVKKKLNT